MSLLVFLENSDSVFVLRPKQATVDSSFYHPIIPRSQSLYQGWIVFLEGQESV